MYHSTMVLLPGESVNVQGSLAVSPFNTSILGATVTVTASLHTAERKDKNIWKCLISNLDMPLLFIQYSPLSKTEIGNSPSQASHWDNISSISTIYWLPLSKPYDLRVKSKNRSTLRYCEMRRVWGWFCIFSDLFTSWRGTEGNEVTQRDGKT